MSRNVAAIVKSMKKPKVPREFKREFSGSVEKDVRAEAEAWANKYVRTGWTIEFNHSASTTKRGSGHLAPKPPPDFKVCVVIHIPDNATAVELSELDYALR